ncbi:MAG TPA: STAS domain-containing protein [Bryobacteraceae bacterium]|jgi:rsbT co-antagonist protein RsbR|nr:STAS domain-containing protein [Bryobacteraceae bacterium]
MTNSLQTILRAKENEICSRWVALQDKLLGGGDVLQQQTRREQSRHVVAAVAEAAQTGNLENIHAPEWRPVLETLSEVSSARALAGASTSETATFLFSLKQPVLELLQHELSDPRQLTDAVWATTLLFDKLGLYTIEVFQKTREDVIRRQQQEMLELSTPVVKLFDELIALPLIGTLDSARTQVVMENLLNNIVATSASIAIVDITGVPTVDTQVAQHLLKTVAAARLMGADCIISGLRPQIAQTIVHLGVELQNVTTKATMADALKLALQRMGYSIVRRGA